MIRCPSYTHILWKTSGTLVLFAYMRSLRLQALRAVPRCLPVIWQWSWALSLSSSLPQIWHSVCFWNACRSSSKYVILAGCLNTSLISSSLSCILSKNCLTALSPLCINDLWLRHCSGQLLSDKPGATTLGVTRSTLHWYVQSLKVGVDDIWHAHLFVVVREF